MPRFGRLISNACLMGVEADPLAELWERLIREPGLEGSERLEFSYQLPQETPLFRMYRRPLEDILSNLLRNSATASMNAGTCRVGVRVECEEDFITGMERVAIRVCDDAPGLFDTAMIRSRTIERGLGLAVDTVSQHGGSIHVEDEQGWVKAVVVRLPRVEKAEETDR